MRILAFLISTAVTIGLIFILNEPLSVGGSKTPRLGFFLSPQEGFWQNAEPNNVDFNADINNNNLLGEVTVYVDERLVPHVYAENENDAYFVQGYLHAKFRLWQMEFQTMAAGGRLSEIMGETNGGTNFLKIDRFFRRIGLLYAAEKTLASEEEDPVTKNELDAYTAGVNAYIASLKPNKYSLEYKLLDYKPERWSNLKSVLFQKYMAFDLSGGDRDFEMTNAKNIFSRSVLEQLYPTTQDSLDPIIPRGTTFEPPSIPATPPLIADSIYFSANPGTSAIQPDPDNGSNNWAVAGSKTQSGAPILCNDPHLALNLPAIWYEMQITTPSSNVYGVSLPGEPSIIIGFNDSCAWGMTNAGRDVKDYYEITFRDSTMQEYLFNGQWLKSSFRNEVIKIKNGTEVVERIAMTVFGPVIYDRKYPNILNNGKYYALRWKALDASNDLLPFYKLNRAKNYVDFIRAITTYQCPGQNFAFASKAGVIAIRQQGQFPAKWHRQGDYLMPGTDSSFLWQGFIPSRENPTIINPERGFVSSANQLATDSTYPYYLGGRPTIYRGISINRQLSAANNVTVQNMMQLQTNTYNVFAETARNILLKNIDKNGLSGNERYFIDLLADWNLKAEASEKGPTIFSLWWNNFENEVYDDEFAVTKLPLPWPDESTLLESLLRDSTYSFIDDVSTAQKETLEQIVSRAYKKSYPQLADAARQNRLEWAQYKDAGVKHLLKLPAFSRLHLPVGGDGNVINAIKTDHGPSWRMVVQMSENIDAYGVYPGGQSGNPGSKYYDNFINTWVKQGYFNLIFQNLQQASSNARMKWKLTFSKA